MAKLTLKQQDDLACARKARMLAKRVLKALEERSPVALTFITEDFGEDFFNVKDDLKAISSLLMFGDDI